MRSFFIVCFMLTASFLFAMGSNDNSDRVIMKVGDIENVANLGAIALDRFSERIVEESNGSIEVKSFHASQMGSANKQLELVKSGTLQAFRGSISWLASFDTGFSLADFPFLYESAEQSKMICNSQIMKDLNDKLADEQGIRFVTAGWIRLPRQILLSAPAESLDDLKGVKLRVPESYSYIESFKALGTAPTPVSFSETYLALKQGVVDGAENHVESLYNMKWHETAKHLLISDHSYDITGFIVNDEWWQSLKDDQRGLIVSIYNEIDLWFEEENKTLQDKYIDKMEQEGVQVHYIDKDKFRNAVYPHTMIHAEEDGEWTPGLWSRIEEYL